MSRRDIEQEKVIEERERLKKEISMPSKSNNALENEIKEKNEKLEELDK